MALAERSCLFSLPLSSLTHDGEAAAQLDKTVDCDTSDGTTICARTPRFPGARLIHGSTSRGTIKATMRGLRILACAVAVLLPQAAEAWTVWAGTSPPDLFNVSTAMASAYRFSHRRPFLRWALAPDFCSALHPLLIEEKSSTFFLSPRWLNFTKCERIHQIAPGLRPPWSAANPNLHFVDDEPVRQSECGSPCRWTAAPSRIIASASRTPPSSTGRRRNASGEPAESADLAVLAPHLLRVRPRRRGDRRLQAEEPPAGRSARCRACSAPRSRRATTRPRAPADGKTITRAFQFNVDDVYKNTDNDPNGQGNVTLENCWRLDNDVCDYVIGLELADTAVLYQQSIQTTFWGVFTSDLRASASLSIFCSGWRRTCDRLDVDRDGKLELQEIVYVLDEFCGGLLRCRCPSVHQKSVRPGVLSVLETIAGTASSCRSPSSRASRAAACCTSTPSCRASRAATPRLRRPRD